MPEDAARIEVTIYQLRGDQSQNPALVSQNPLLECPILSHVSRTLQ